MDYKDIVKTTNIIKISPDDTLSSALAQLGSSHDSAFVFSDEKKFMGVINPYYCVIKTSYPGNAKVEHCLFHPPKIRNKYSISRVAQLFIESKLHYLPIFDDNDKFVGVASARHLLNAYRNSTFFNVRLNEYLQIKNTPVMTIYENDLISTALSTFKNKKISKLIVVDKNKRLRGVLTYYDLISYLMSPKHKSHKGDREGGDKISFYYQQVKNFAKTHVLTLTPGHTLHDCLNLILDEKIGSVVIIDDQRVPLGVITTRDFLNFLTLGKREKRIEVSGKDLSEKSRYILGGFFTQFQKWAKKLPDIDRVKLFIKEEKEGGAFKTVLSLIPKKGSATVVTREGKNLMELLRSLRINDLASRLSSPKKTKKKLRKQKQQREEAE